MKWMLLPLRRYAEFRGRSRRLEYWMFTLLFAIVGGAWLAVYFALGGRVDDKGDLAPGGGAPMTWTMIGLVACVAILVPHLAVQVRRFHDRNMSGWWVLLHFVPYVGSLILLVLMAAPGTLGPNRYGEDPKERWIDDDDEIVEI